MKFQKIIAVSIVSLLGSINLPPAFGIGKGYIGSDADVYVSCVLVGEETQGAYSINSQKSGILITEVDGIAYFENDPRSAQGIQDRKPPTTRFNGTPKVYPFPTFNFGAFLATARGINPNTGGGSVLLPDLFSNPNAVFGYTVNCPQ